MLETLYSSNAAPMPGIPIDHAQAATNMPWSYNTSASSATDSSARRRRTQLDPRRNRPSATASYGQSSASNRNTSANSTTSASDDGTISLTIPPPIDPGVFRSLKEIRRLVDDAADLALRAASGIVGPSGPSPDIAFLAGGNTYGSGTNGNNTNSNPGGRKSTLSTLRLNRMRAQAVEKLAAAYRIDEVATCVMVMKGTSALEDLADRVLRQGECYLLYAQSPAHLPSADSSNIDAQYVRFFHQKVPSRWALIVRWYTCTAYSSHLIPLTIALDSSAILRPNRLTRLLLQDQATSRTTELAELSSVSLNNTTPLFETLLTD